jgi:hypothetical protein
MTRTRIMRTLDFGAMMTIAYPLRRDEREAVAAFLGRAGDEPGPKPDAFCADRTVTIQRPPCRVQATTMVACLAALRRLKYFWSKGLRTQLGCAGSRPGATPQSRRAWILLSDRRHRSVPVSMRSEYP